MDTMGLVLRVALSLATVVGLIWLFGRGLLKAPGVRAGGGSAVRMLGRQQLSRGTSVVVVGVGDQAMVLGVSEQGVTMLTRMSLDEVDAAPTPATSQRTQLDLGDLAVPDDVAGLTSRRALAPRRRAAVPRRRADSRLHEGLSGSALSPHTWTQALVAVRERTTRR